MKWGFKAVPVAEIKMLIEERAKRAFLDQYRDIIHQINP
jgi:hypothetical protein